MRDRLVELQGVSKVYQEGEKRHTVLANIDLEIERGSFIVLLGRSGAGKSTLLNLISGIDLPSAGRVLWESDDLSDLTEEARTLHRRRHIGFVFQSFNLIPTLTVEENILLPLELNEMQREETRQQALGFLDEVGLGSRLSSFPDRLSGGEQQRVAIARAIAHNPDLLLADEPTGNLDDATADQVLAIFERLVREARQTALVVTHDRSLVAMADRVLELRAGVLHEISPAAA